MTVTTETARALRIRARIAALVPTGTPAALAAFADDCAAAPGADAETARAVRIRARVASLVRA
ncbi:hypothetical protein [Sandarakinorhabdus sp. DWP1-3-1]|uniref:hypothetical protein n=1 Tax=Sandarakinorhabdus sp. DWP1-3-1 TaxID=2804627 RepID=UPI003CF7DE2A